MKSTLKLEIENFYRNNRDGLFRYAVSLIQDSNEAEDLVHTGMQVLVEFVRENQCLPDHLRCFVVTCIRNAAVDTLRKRQVSETMIVDISHIMQKDMMAIEHENLARLFSLLTENEKEVILLRDILGYSFREISRIHKRSMFTVASWHRRGICKLRLFLLEEAQNENM
ncbi:sigma-70 family RNA polymerase sigma factor [bacterium]|nr:sigma-70 family RNA polymerase sigma factor [candidate division CSSED10-310 bacterium]